MSDASTRTEQGIPIEGYNERLFTKPGLRQSYHLARYRWCERVLAKRAQMPLRVVELGCFDGKLIDYLPGDLERYVGLDANWEGGLDIGRVRFKDRPKMTLRKALTAAEMQSYGAGEFNIAVALETLEHLPTEVMRDYLRELARVTNGLLLVSVPNEMGLVFVAKYLVKKFRYGSNDPYTRREFIAAATWRPQHVARNEHKGFDYRQLLKEIARHFEICSVEAVPSLGLPPSLSLTVGIVARSR